VKHKCSKITHYVGLAHHSIAN